MEHEIRVQCETVVIEGGRNLYNYTFLMDGKALAPMEPDEVLQTQAPADEAGH